MGGAIGDWMTKGWRRYFGSVRCTYRPTVAY